MNEKLSKEFGSGQRLDILTELKRHGGRSVKELSAHFRMSYMGVKGHCLDLHRDGYLTTWRRPKPLGRPELVYRLTRRAHELYPGATHQLTGEILEAVQQTYGPAAPTKMLFVVFAHRLERYRAQLPGADLSTRAEALARLRDAEGYMAEFYSPPAPGNGKGPELWDRLPGRDRMQIVEHHSPLEEVLRRYPIVARLERELFERALDCPVDRTEEHGEGRYRCTFYLGPAGASVKL